MLKNWAFLSRNSAMRLLMEATLKQRTLMSRITEKAQPIQIIIPHASLVTVQVRQTSISASSAKGGMITIEETSCLPLLSSESRIYMEYQRREFLQILGVASNALLLSFPLDWGRVSNALEKPSRLDSSVMQSFEAL